ncbi:MAG: AAA family ATPase, partial [Actinomycetota bacterium]
TGDWAEVGRSISSGGTQAVVIGPDASKADLAEVLSTTREHPAVAFVMVAADLEDDVAQEAKHYGISDVVSADAGNEELSSVLAAATAAARRATTTDAKRSKADAKARAKADAEAQLEAAAKAAADAEAKVAATRTSTRKHRGDLSEVVSVFSPKGGTGKTTVAVNLAVAAAESGVKVALVDGNVRFGDCATLLRLRPKRTLADIASVTEEPDEVVMESVLTHHESGVELLAAPSEPSAGDLISARALAGAIRALKKSYELVIVDTGPAWDAHTQAALTSSDMHLLVTTPEITSMKDAHLALSGLDILGVDSASVYVVVNRSDSQVAFPTSEVGRSLDRKVVAMLPSDVSVPISANLGQPITAQSSKNKFSKAIVKMAADFAGQVAPQDDNQPTKSVFARAVRYVTNT